MDIEIINLTGGEIPSEFKDIKKISDIFNKYNLTIGRMICGSKSTYREKHPEHLVIFNANIVTEKRNKIWFGDLDVTLDFDNLKNVADILQEDLYILYEMDARFENEDKPFEFYKSKAKTIIKHS